MRLLLAVLMMVALAPATAHAAPPTAKCEFIPTPENPAARQILLGGSEVGQNTLLRFYVLHVILMPLAAAVFLAVHFWRIRKDGGISGPL